MDSKWIGPYRIMKSMGKGLYQIESADTPNVKIQRVYGIHLKPYYPSAKTVSSSVAVSLQPPYILKYLAIYIHLLC